MTWIGLLPSAAQNYELPLSHFTNTQEVNPLPGTAATCVFQDKDHYIWIAIYGQGLVRYDGTKMELLTPENGLSSYIFSITQDQSGRLWVGSSDGGLVASAQSLNDYLPGDTLSFSKKIDSIPLSSLSITGSTQLLADSFGNIWTSTREAILRYHYDEKDLLQVDTIKVPSKTYGSFLFSFLQRSTGEICAMNKAPHIFHISPVDGNITYDSLSFESAPIGNNKNVIHLLESKNRTLWGVNAGGDIWSLNPNEPLKPKIHSALSGKGRRDLMETREGYLISTTLGSGLIEWQGDNSEKAIYYTTRNGLLTNAVWHTTQDNEGNIWMATNSGLSRMPADYHAFGHYTDKAVGGASNMLPEAAVNDVLVDFEWKNHKTTAIEKMIVAATSSGISLIRTDGTREIMTAKEGLLSNAQLNAHQDKRGRLWLMGRSGLTCISQNKQALKLPGFDTPRSHRLWDIQIYVSTLPLTHFTGAKTIWLPKSETDQTLFETTWFVGASLLLVLIDEQWFGFARKAGLKPSGLAAISVDDQNYIYLGDIGTGFWKTQFPLTVDKIWSLDAEYGKNKRYNKFLNVEESVFELEAVLIDSDTINEVSGLVWHDSLLWASTNYGVVAIAREVEQALLVFNEEDGLIENSAAGLILNQDSTMIWAATRGGLYGIDLASKELVKNARKKDGLVSNAAWGHPSLASNEEGILHFATAGGLSLYDPTHDQSDTLAPVVRFRNFQYKEKANGNNELLVEYAALSYSYEAGIRYKTRLKGYDEDWSEETRETSIRYTNLSATFWPKRYVFEVLAGDEERNWSKEPAAYDFEVNPPWYLHWLAIIFYGFVAVFLVRSIIKWRTSNLLKRQQQLEKTVSERTAEVVAEKERSDELLLNILPAETAEELKQYGFAKAKNYDLVTIIFTDFKEFTLHSERMTPEELIAEIDHCFKAFDHIMEKFGVEKIKTVGDAYLAAAGLPTRNTTHGIDAIKASLAIRDFMLQYKAEREEDGRHPFEIRIGVNTGPVVAGIVGIKKFAYDIWGDTVNLAARMESNSEVGKVNISNHTYELIKGHADFSFIARGKIQAKHKGEIEMYFVDWAKAAIV